MQRSVEQSLQPKLEGVAGTGDTSIANHTQVLQKLKRKDQN